MPRPAKPTSTRRCPWAKGDLYEAYHDTEWGVPQRDDRVLFEFLVLEAAQAGLSWSTILNKRDNFRVAFDEFDPQHVARYGQRKIQSLLGNAGIIRNRLKIEASISNARAFLDVQEAEGSFAQFLWNQLPDAPHHNAWRTVGQVPARTPASDALSKELKRRGFRFVGSTICYAFMQATGLVNDHLVTCFRHRQLHRT